jgi:hypothetical protein
MKFQILLSKKSLFALILILISTSQIFSDNGPAHKKKLARPIKLGVSGGNVNDQTAEFCCAGTLGALVRNSAGANYILSNNHVLGIANKAKLGDAITQPGSIDNNCNTPDSNIVARFTKFIKIKFGANTNNKVDAAIAEAIPGFVSTTGFILDIKNPGQPAQAELGMGVKKSGRTTGLRRGVVDTLNLTVRVSFSNQCGSNGSKVARFTDQIGIADTPGGTPPPFIAGGDSGSLLVRNVANCPATLGLLFAGDDVGNAAANRIQNVLNILGQGMKIVGCGTQALQIEDPYALTMNHPQVLNAAAIQKRYEDALLSIPGVVGVGIGLASPHSRELAMVVYTVRGTDVAKATNILPERLDNLPVRKKMTGEFRAL